MYRDYSRIDLCLAVMENNREKYFIVYKNNVSIYITFPLNYHPHAALSFFWTSFFRLLLKATVSKIPSQKLTPLMKFFGFKVVGSQWGDQSSWWSNGIVAQSRFSLIQPPTRHAHDFLQVSSVNFPEVQPFQIPTWLSGLLWHGGSLENRVNQLIKSLQWLGGSYYLWFDGN